MFLLHETVAHCDFFVWLSQLQIRLSFSWVGEWEFSEQHISIQELATPYQNNINSNCLHQQNVDNHNVTFIHLTFLRFGFYDFCFIAAKHTCFDAHTFIMNKRNQPCQTSTSEQDCGKGLTVA